MTNLEWNAAAGLVYKALEEDAFCLDDGLRDHFEVCYQTPLDGVRIHTGPAAAAAAGALGARAFAFGNHIVFGAGEYQPGTPEGLSIMAHELAHCVQQRRAPSSPVGAGLPSDPTEEEAHQAASLALLGRRTGQLTGDCSGLVRRVVSIRPGSAKIVPQKVAPGPVIPGPFHQGETVLFDSTPIRATGEVTLNGAPGDSAVGWRAGFIQVEWVETNWLYYRGLANTDGSIFYQRARPPAKQQVATRDTLNRHATDPPGTTVDLVFYDGYNHNGGVADGAAGVTFPLTLKFTHFDRPSNRVNANEPNEKAHGAQNFLREAQFEDMFCTILSVRDPAGHYHHQAAFYWNVRSQVTVVPGPGGVFTPRRVADGCGGAISHVILGTPTDKKFTGVLTSHQDGSSNDLFGLSTSRSHAVGSANRHVSEVWDSWNVTRP